ncbi:MAG: DUF721 domain-containing protein [Terriglobia bacterium]
MDEIGKILPSLFSKQIRREEPYLLEILLPLWPRIVGKSIAQHCQPTLFASGVLSLASDSATWAKQLVFLTEEVRAKINGFLGQPIVRKLRIKTMTQPSLFSSTRPSRGISAPSPPVMERAVDTSSILDPAIASALASSYAKYFNRPRR